MKMKRLFLITTGFLFIFVAAAVFPPNPLKAENQQTLLKEDGLAEFADAFFQGVLETQGIPGAVFVVVEEGEIVLAKGYGYADLASQEPVTPDDTIFRAASVSKLFTATAVMQLVEAGQLDLNEPVEFYLPYVSIDRAQPVTIAHLLTHTAGFDDRLAGLALKDEDKLYTLADQLANNLPPVVLPPGDQISYSNYGYALAGLLVEEVSGESYDHYVNNHIFQPLLMTRSSIADPPPTFVHDALATGYTFAGTALRPAEKTYFQLPPAGSLYTTGEDMAHFMIAHLQEGQYEGERILSPETIQVMQRQQFTHHPELPGWAFGFHEIWQNGRRGLAHRGDITGYASLLFLLPQDGVGFFVSFNAPTNFAAGGKEPREELIQQFMDRFYPAEELPSSEVIGETDLNHFTGKFRLNRYARTNFEKGIPPMPLLQYRVVANEDGTLTVTPPTGMGTAARWQAVGPLLFQEVDGAGRLAFRENENGQITHLFTNMMQMAVAAEKVSWFETDIFQAVLIFFFFLIFISTLIWPIQALRRKSTTLPEKRARMLAGMVAFLNFVFLIIFLVRMTQASFNVFGETPLYFWAALLLPLVTAVLTPILLYLTFKSWRVPHYSIAGRIHYTLVTLAALLFIWFVHYWNLLGYQL